MYLKACTYTGMCYVPLLAAHGQLPLLVRCVPERACKVSFFLCRPTARLGLAWLVDVPIVLRLMIDN